MALNKAGSLAIRLNYLTKPLPVFTWKIPAGEIPRTPSSAGVSVQDLGKTLAFTNLAFTAEETQVTQSLPAEMLAHRSSAKSMLQRLSK